MKPASSTTSPRLSWAVQSFLTYCESRNLSPRTIQFYDEKLTDWVRLLRDPCPTQVTTDQIRDLIVYWKHSHRLFPQLPPKERGIGLAPSTINGYIRALKAFFSFLVDDGLIESNPASRIKLLKVPANLGQVLTPAELRALIRASAGTALLDRRNHALVLVLADTGIRIGELCGLDVHDLQWSERTIRVMGKGAKVRAVPFGRRCARGLNSYLAFHPDSDNGDAPLFVTVRGDRLPRRRAQRILEGLARRAGIEGKRVTPHVFRRTFATLWISNGGDPFTLQRMLGHTTMEMVNRYVRLSTRDLQRRHAVLQPVDGLEGQRRI